MEQQYTSKQTSINKNKLPSLAKKIDFSIYEHKTLLDYGCGKYDNFLNYLLEMNIKSFGYDKYNRSEENNNKSISQKYDVITCNNVLNVIAEDAIITFIIKHIKSLLNNKGIAYFTVYEGNKTGIGAVSKKDCYQRNNKTKEYIVILNQIFNNVEVKNNVLICKD